MTVDFRLPSLAELIADLEVLRFHGLTSIRRLELKALYEAAKIRHPTSNEELGPGAVEKLLKNAVSATGGGNLQVAAEYTFGLVPGTKDWPRQERRRAAADAYNVSVERFRKAQEKTIYEQVAEEIIKLCHNHMATPDTTSAGISTQHDQSPVATEYSTSIPKAPTFASDRIGTSALFTVDDVPDANISAIAQDARELSIVGRTAINVVAGYRQTVLGMLRGGCELRLVLVDPDCEAARYLYGKNFAIYRRNLALAVDHLKSLNEELHRDYPDRLIQIRLMTDIPPFSLLFVEKSDPRSSFIQVQLNFLYTRISRDRPMLRLYRKDPWFERFLDEFAAIWKEHSEPSSVDELAEYIERMG